MKIPDLRFEYTSTRPWTFTHPDFSYTHRRSFIGAVNGPSSISYRIESFYYPTSKLVTQLTFEKILKGIKKLKFWTESFDGVKSTLEELEVLMEFHEAGEGSEEDIDTQYQLRR